MISWNDISKARIDEEGGNYTLVLDYKGNLNFNIFRYIFRMTAKSQLKNM